MGKSCSFLQVLTIIFGLLNFLVGVPVLFNSFFRRYWQDDEEDTDQKESSGWLDLFDVIFCIFGFILLLILISSSIGSVWCGFKSKYQELLARGTVLLLKISIVLSVILFVVGSFLLGYHWIGLLPLLCWGFLFQLVFLIIVIIYVNELTKARGEEVLTVPGYYEKA